MASIVDERGYNQSFISSPAQVLRLRRRAKAIISALPPVAPGQQRHIMELGCARGEMAAQLADLTDTQVTGVDISEKFIQEARQAYRRPNLDFIVADLTREEPADEQNCYDAITGNGILHHLHHHLDTVLPALYRWLKPGGRLVFWEPNLWNPYIYLIFSFSPLRHMARLEPDEMAFTTTFIHRHLRAAGYSPLDIATRDFLLPNTPSSLIRPVAALSNLLDRVPLLNRTAQSIFFTAEKPHANAGRGQ